MLTENGRHLYVHHEEYHRLLERLRRDGLDRDPGRDHQQGGLQLVLDGLAWSLGLGGVHLGGNRRRDHQHPVRHYLNHLGAGLPRAYPG